MSFLMVATKSEIKQCCGAIDVIWRLLNLGNQTDALVVRAKAVSVMPVLGTEESEAFYFYLDKYEAFAVNIQIF